MASKNNHFDVDVRAMLQRFGGPAVLQRKLVLLHDQSPSISTMHKWMYRKSIPLWWFAILASQARSEGWTLNILEFLTDAETNKDLDPAEDVKPPAP